MFVYNAAGQLIAEYTSPDTISNNGLSYLTSDHLGSARVVTDINGNVKSRHDYLPFGEEIDASHLPVGLSYGAADGEHQKFTAPFLLGASVVMALACILFGIFPL